MTEIICHVGVRETGARRHKLLGDGRLTTKRVHAIRFAAEDRAADAAAWLFDNNPAAFDSARVLDGETGRLLKQVRLRG